MFAAETFGVEEWHFWFFCLGNVGLLLLLLLLLLNSESPEPENRILIEWDRRTERGGERERERERGVSGVEEGGIRDETVN